MRDIKLRTCTLKSIYSSRDFLALCIGNHMISSAIWNKYKARVNFSKTNKFGVFEKLTSAYLFQIAREKSCHYLLRIYMKKFRDGLRWPNTVFYCLCLINHYF